MQVRFHYSLETVAGFILPYAVIITCYVLILKRLRQTKFRRKVRSEKLILAIVVMFCLFWLPYHVINMIQVCLIAFTSCSSKLNGPFFSTNTVFWSGPRWQLNGTRKDHADEKCELKPTKIGFVKTI